MNVFSLYCNYLPLKKVVPHICTHLNPHYLMKHRAKYGWNLLIGSGEENIFFISSMYFRSFVIISPWKRAGKGWDPSFKKLDFPLPKDALCQVWLKLAQWFLRRRFFNFVKVFSLFRNYFPLRKGRSPSFDQTWTPFTQGQDVKLQTDRQPDRQDRQTNRQTTNEPQAIRKPYVSFQLRWA